MKRQSQFMLSDFGVCEPCPAAQNKGSEGNTESERPGNALARGQDEPLRSTALVPHPCIIWWLQMRGRQLRMPIHHPLRLPDLWIRHGLKIQFLHLPLGCPEWRVARMQLSLSFQSTRLHSWHGGNWSTLCEHSGVSILDLIPGYWAFRIEWNNFAPISENWKLCFYCVHCSCSKA